MKREASFKRLHHLVSDKTEKLPRERSLLGSTNHIHKPWSQVENDIGKEMSSIEIVR